MGNRLLALAGKPLKPPECQRVLLGKKGDFETDFPVSGDLASGWLNYPVIEPCAKTAHRIAVANFERLRDKRCGEGNGVKRHHGNLRKAACTERCFVSTEPTTT